METTEQLIDVHEAARILNVYVDTVRRWARTGKIKSILISSRGDRRYRLEDIEEFIRENRQK